ncbi:Autoinducer 2 sensor kinase/phosphatase luxQ [Brevundimonas vesicularis]|uniref:histidine kinase n=2 Tax=Brevundimonas vesicularis TaxID=41276 RepID=A0A2X1D859_BREVE|nr:Autoinducer 2 sensor kinase/phosphatase luxQ [Brevundimonas vesicularis]
MAFGEVWPLTKMPPFAQAHEMRWLKAVAATVLVVVCLGMTIAMLLVSRAIDERAAAHEQTMVERRLERMLNVISDDIVSATIWNDAVDAVKREDTSWMQSNFSDYYAQYMDHAVTLVFSGDGRLILASRGGQAVDAASEAALIAAVQDLAADVRRTSLNPARRQAVGFKAVSRGSSIIRAGDALYLVGAATVVPEDLAPVARPPRDAIVVSAKPISAFVTSLHTDLGLHDTRLTTPDERHFVSLQGRDGTPIAGLVWAPDRPGRHILATLLPVFAGLLFMFLIAAALMWRRVAANVRRLSDSERALSEALKAADAANLAKSRFLANMSHELRTPLNGVLGMSEVVLMSDLSAAQRGQIGVIKESGEHLLVMIERILEMAHIDDALAEPERRPFDPASVFAKAAAGLRAKAEAKGLAITETYQPTGLRLGDAGRVSKVLTALIDNAIQFTRTGGVRLTLEPSSEGLIFRVADTGPGMSEAVQTKLFTPFSQGDDSATRSVDGAGLGLALARRLATSMGAVLDYETRIGLGTTFRLLLPAPEAPSDDDRSETAA